MTETVRVTVLRKGRPLKVVLERFTITESTVEVADEITSTLRYEKSVTKGHTRPEHDVYEQLADHNDLSDPAMPEYMLPHDDRDRIPRRIVFGSIVLEIDGVNIHLAGREEPLRALRTHEFGPGFDSVDLILEEIVKLRSEGLGNIEDVDARIDLIDTDVRAVSGLGDTVYCTLMADLELLPPGSELDHDFVADHAGGLCISPRYEHLIEAVLRTRCLDDVTSAYPNNASEEEIVIAGISIGVYLTMAGSTARKHGLVPGEHLSPSEMVLAENIAEATPATETVKRAIASSELETELRV